MLARLARWILEGKARIHKRTGALAGEVVERIGGGGLAKKTATALAQRIPLPGDEQVVAVARGLQITGVMICLANEQDLARCACLRDLAMAEAKAKLKEMFAAAAEDWARGAAEGGLARFAPSKAP